jgi:hypothetical protein
MRSNGGRLAGSSSPKRTIKDLLQTEFLGTTTYILLQKYLHDSLMMVLSITGKDPSIEGL